MTLQPGTPYGTDAYLVMLSVQDSVARRVDLIYSQAADDLTEFMYQAEQGNLVLTASEQRYYAALRDEADRLARIAQREAGTLLDQTITSAFVEGALTHADDLAFNVVHDQAVRALSGYSLDLIQQTTDTMRRAVQQQIGVALVEGLSAAELRQRILTTGLSNIPRWRSVQERAGVIARTEIMRAYNTGALAGIQATGAHFVRWIASPDEATCSICGPRHGKVFRLPGAAIGGVGDPFGPGIARLPVGEPPAHPRCRCTIRAHYRDQSGRVIGTPVTPRVPAGGLTANAPVPAHPPSVAGTFDDELANLADTMGLDDAGRTAYWRSLDLNGNPEFVDRLTTAVADPMAFKNLMRYRYGVGVDSWGSLDLAAWKASGQIRRQTIVAIERYRTMFGDQIVGGKRFTRLWMGPGQRVPFGPNVLADCYADGVIRLNLRELLPYGNRGIRIVDADGVDEILTHELGHALHNAAIRYDSFGVLTPPTDTTLLNAWRAARRGSLPYPGPNPTVAVAVNSERIIAQGEAWKRLAAEWDSLPDIPLDLHPGKFYRQIQITLSDGSIVDAAALDQATAATIAKPYITAADATRKVVSGKADFIPTQYAQENEWEDFAESATMFIFNGARLKAYSPKRYSFMAKLFAKMGAVL